jgi:hypothetical protein
MFLFFRALAFLKTYRLKDALIEVQFKTRKKKIYNSTKKIRTKSIHKHGQISLLNVPLKSNGLIEYRNSNSESDSLIGDSLEFFENNTVNSTLEETQPHALNSNEIKKPIAIRLAQFEKQANGKYFKKNVPSEYIEACSRTDGKLMLGL